MFVTFLFTAKFKKKKVKCHVVFSLAHSGASSQAKKKKKKKRAVN